MEALHLLEQLQRMGIGLTAVGGTIRAAPKAALTDQIRTLIRAHKPALLAALRADGGAARGLEQRRYTTDGPAGPAVWSAEDWQTLFEERAGIAEFDGGLPRADAERHAFEYCVIEWMNRVPDLSDPNRCAWCRRGDRADQAVLPLRAAVHRDVWLHAECWELWYRMRRDQAEDALAAMGIGPTRGISAPMQEFTEEGDTT